MPVRSPPPCCLPRFIVTAAAARSWSHIHGLSLLLLEDRLPVEVGRKKELADEVTNQFVDLLATGTARAPALGLDFSRLDAGV